MSPPGGYRVPGGYVGVGVGALDRDKQCRVGDLYGRLIGSGYRQAKKK